MTARVLILLSIAFAGARCIGTGTPGHRPDTGTIKVTAKYSGPAQPPAKSGVRVDEVCRKMHPSGYVVREGDVVLDDGMLPFVFVYIKFGIQASYAVPTEPALLDEKGCTFSPHVMGMRVGQTLRITNRDATAHSARRRATLSSVVDPPQSQTGPTDRNDFNQPEVMATFSCDVHPWMKAYVGVVDHPFFAVTAYDPTTMKYRKAQITGLPDGGYEVEAWHEKWGRRSQRVSLRNGETRSIEFVFPATIGSDAKGSRPPASGKF